MMIPVSMHRETFVTLVGWKLNTTSSQWIARSDIDIVASHVMDFFISNCANVVKQSGYFGGDGSTRIRNILHCRSKETSIIVEVFTPRPTAMGPPTDLVMVSLDRYQNKKTERVFPSVSFGVRNVKRMKPREFFDMMWNHLSARSFFSGDYN